MIIRTRWDKARLFNPAISVLLAGLFVSTAVFAQSDETKNSDETQSAVQDLHITVESGDTFSGIVTRELNSYDAWGEIARYNKLDSPDDLKPGDVIIIPAQVLSCLLYTSPSPRDATLSRMPSSA